MKLYLVRRTDEVGYDEFDSFVCAAEDAVQAVRTHPRSNARWNQDEYKGRWWDNDDQFGPLDTWAHPNTLTAEEIGTTERPAGVILTSFNAG